MASPERHWLTHIHPLVWRKMCEAEIRKLTEISNQRPNKMTFDLPFTCSTTHSYSPTTETTPKEAVLVLVLTARQFPLVTRMVCFHNKLPSSQEVDSRFTLFSKCGTRQETNDTNNSRDLWLP